MRCIFDGNTGIHIRTEPIDTIVRTSSKTAVVETLGATHSEDDFEMKTLLETPVDE